MNHSEQALTFSVAGESLLGIAAVPETPRNCAVLMAVGGPQYRVGSHRQFLLLSRRLAAEGYPVFRFDYRGMGDSEGGMRSFEQVSDDIGAAIDAFRNLCPQVRHLVLWGLCDAASSILMYLQATRDPRVDGLVLLNPWVRSEASLAQTHIKHYYAQRLLQREFWIKLLSGRMRLLASLGEFLRNARKAGARASADPDRALSFQGRMAEGWREFSGNILLVLSGEDYTAREFIEYCATDRAWNGLLDAGNVCRIELPGADHTFSSAALRARAEEEILQWLGKIFATQDAR